MEPNAARLRGTSRLLNAMTPSDFARLQKHLQLVELAPRELLADAGDRIKHVYFPHSAVISLVAVMTESGMAETAMIGREGVAGFEALLGNTTAMHRTIVQVGGPATRIAVRDLAGVVPASSTLQALFHRYFSALFVQVTQSVACNTLHKLEARCARWLLMAQDRARRERFELTQEFLAEMLGVHRPTVTFVARALQAAGLIRYSRGILTILDREGLEAAACECYSVARRAYAKAVS
jgi:CRP-like cAMP-binding protein